MKFKFGFKIIIISSIFFFLPEMFPDILAQQSPTFSKDNIEQFLDSLISLELKKQNIVGCALSIVKDSTILFSKGYGYADLETKKPVNAFRTIFRTASVCKVVTATALMQLKEKGLIDFNSDINKYLKKFKIKDKFGRPVTATNLLTHTPGFDDFYIGKSARSEMEAMPLGDFLKKFLPQRIVPPGEIFSYSNMGMALAAFLVEEITGKDFEDYVIENIFSPLEMKKSSYRIKKEYKDDVYKGYVYLNGKQFEFPFDFINDYPAGQMLTTINEFSNFMLMQLNGGRFKDRQVVGAGSIKEMQSVQFTHDANLHTAVGYGFMIDKFSGMKLLMHDGGYPGILTKMWLFPEIKLGIFIAVNGYNSSINDVISEGLMNRFFPFTTPAAALYPLTQLPDYDKNIDRFTGEYRFTRYSRNEISKMGLLTGKIGGELPIWKNDQGMLMMFDFTRKERRLIQITPLLFCSIDDDYYIKFREDKNGKITHLFTDGISSFEKVPILLTIKVQKLILTTISLLFAALVLTGWVRTLKRKIRKSENKKSYLFRLAEGISSLYLFYFLLVGLLMVVFADPLEQMVGFPYGMPWYFYIVQLLPLLFIMFLIWFLFKLIVSVKSGFLSSINIAAYSLFVFVCIVSVWVMNYWNLIGFKF